MGVLSPLPSSMGHADVRSPSSVMFPQSSTPSSSPLSISEATATTTVEFCGKIPEEGDLTPACPIDDASGDNTPVSDFEVGHLWLCDRMYHMLHLFLMFLPAKCNAIFFCYAYKQCCCCAQQYCCCAQQYCVYYNTTYCEQSMVGQVYDLFYFAYR